eukprot:TRINITY_DN3901_c0_g1_i1.p1 TRINITY_DN3901_c0_g1~~TRINITY_DN3901_c0_g1_i1.p1  ORF type:complete len:251 (+),score=41.57 TRINITY_DN3901_c0_g1_i1:51-755(+)
MSSNSKTLHVFDFDGTLFKSPLPDPKYLSKREFGRLRSDGGWFHLSPSLDPPAVPEEVPEDMWIGEVREAALRAIGDEDCTAILLTGRGEKVFRERVVEILRCGGLEFSGVYLKPKGTTTLAFKEEVILKHVKEGHDKVIIYEDRIKHVERFRNFLTTLPLESGSVRHINYDESQFYLTEPVQRTVVAQMRELHPELFADSKPKGADKHSRGSRGKGRSVDEVTEMVKHIKVKE